LRNSVGIAEHPITGGIYSVDMGMDYATRNGKDISQNNPGDELNYRGIIGKANDLDQGLNHGYPYCHAAWELPRRLGTATPLGTWMPFLIKATW